MRMGGMASMKFSQHALFTLPLSCAECLNILGPSTFYSSCEPYLGLYRDSLSFIIHLSELKIMFVNSNQTIFFLSAEFLQFVFSFLF